MIVSYVQHNFFAKYCLNLVYYNMGLKFWKTNTLSSGWQCCDMKFPLYSTSNNVLGMCAETMEPWKQRSSKRKLKSIHSMKRTKFGVLSKFEFTGLAFLNPSTTLATLLIQNGHSSSSQDIWLCLGCERDHVTMLPCQRRKHMHPT